MRYIQPNELRDWWSFVRPGLEKIKTKSTEPWIPEDVYADCYSQRSLLWVLFSNDRPTSFVVLQPAGNFLHVWCAYAYEDDCLEIGWEKLKEVAKQFGWTKISFDSDRRGWDKVAGRLGFKPRRWVAEI
jgi:hypothetical protein